MLLVLSGIFFSCQSHPESTLFHDRTSAETGIDFTNQLRYSEDFNMIDYLYYYDGGGVAVGDINNDGLSDVYFVSNEGGNALYLNLGNMKFSNITISAGVVSPGPWKSGVSMADVNGDGLLDIYLCRMGDYKGITGHNELFINQGDLTFVEEASEYNLDFVGFATQASFFDMDNDGDLDVYLLNHSVHTSKSFGNTQLRNEVDSLAGDRIYRNDHNYFTDVSAESGIYRSQIGYGLGLGHCDINKDGFADIFISNDFTENDYLYINNRDGTFTDVYPEMADHTSLSSMGCDLADFNNDGLTDVLTLDMLPADEITRKSTIGEDPKEIFDMKLSYGYMPQYKRNTLQLNRGNGTFSDIAIMAGIHATDWSWSPLFADFDNDGWKDIFISNGIPGRPNDIDYLHFIERSEIIHNPNIPDTMISNKMPPGLVANYFFKNNTDLTFKDVSRAWGVAPGRITNGIAYCDLDNDGDLDLVLNNLDAQAVIKENTSSKDTSVHFLALDLIGNKGNTRAIGAKVEVYHEANYQMYEHYTVRGFKSSVDPRIHIGLGKDRLVDSIRVTWPGGNITNLRDIRADQFLQLYQSEATEATHTKPAKNILFTSIAGKELGVDYQHRENRFIEFNREPLIPHMHSREGPAIAVADVNGDTLDDFFVGGAKHQAGRIYLQGKHGFELTQQTSLMQDELMEDVDADFIDFDKDGDMDLVVVSGGNEFDGESPNRQPRLYSNDGAGKFTSLRQTFKNMYQTGSCLAIHDFDGDGWQDIFFGSQVMPWNYGLSPKSYLVKNEKGKSFLDYSEYLPDHGKLGMINDAIWVDMEGKGEKSLVLAGEWMDITILKFNGVEFERKTIPESSGWWKTINCIDIDEDGDMDILGGNLGLNTKLKASKQEPINLYDKDFDRNGKPDAVMTTGSKKDESIFTSMDILVSQIPSVGKKFLTGRSYAEASVKEILGDDLDKTTKLTATEMRSGIFINESDGFQFKPFPNIMQISFIRGFLIDDFDGDGRKDICAIGNLYPASVQEGSYTADRGTILSIDPQSYLQTTYPIDQPLRGDFRHIGQIRFKNKKIIMVAANNDSLQWLIVK
jgi:hypothetical protein